MAKMSKDALGEDVALGADTGGPVEIRRLPDGRAMMLPVSPYGRKLNVEAVEVLADIQGVMRDMITLREELDVLIEQARMCRAPWALIGFSVGTTGEAARKRWRDEEDKT
jgi:hypothetical protein